MEEYISIYNSSTRKILLKSNGEELTGLYLDTQIDIDNEISKNKENSNIQVFKEAVKWLDIYFSGKEPDFMPKIKLIGTEFKRRVWSVLLTIPYGTTLTYGDIAKVIEKQTGVKKMSAQAVGGAVSSNPISIIVPCHRVVGKNNNLTGYAGGIDKKIELLKLEKIDVAKYSMPKENN